MLLILLLVILDHVFNGLSEPDVEIRVHASTLPAGRREVVDDEHLLALTGLPARDVVVVLAPGERKFRDMASSIACTRASTSLFS
jgi:hypothetical protein